jgi:hypothetical protein
MASAISVSRRSTATDDDADPFGSSTVRQIYKAALTTRRRTLLHMAARPDFPRQVHNGDAAGDDVYGHKRAMHRLLGDGQLDELEGKPVSVRRTPGIGFEALVRRLQRKARQPQTGVFTERLYNELWRVAAYDAKAQNLVVRYNATHQTPKLVYPFPSNVNARLCQGLHETGGLPGNWALDWCAPPGSPLVAVEKATVSRLSGSDPDVDRPDAYGVFGWTTYYVARDLRREWFWTHQGRREPGIHVGQVLEAGDPVGYVGDQDYRPDHIHGGVSSPLGEADARRHVEAVNRAGKVTL